MYTRGIGKYYEKKHKRYSIPSSDSLAFNLQNHLDSSFTGCGKTYRTKTTFIPLILYYYYKQKNESHINPNIYINDFNNYLKNVLESSGLKDSLRGRRIEIEFKKIPNTVKFEYIRTTTILVLFILKGEQLQYTHDVQEASLHFTILDSDNTILKEGDLNETIESSIGYFQLFNILNGFIDKNMFNFDVEVELAMKRMVSSIIREIE